MKAQLASEIYVLDGQDPTGVIPKGVVSAIVSYQGGIVERVYFTPEAVIKAKDIAAVKAADIVVAEVNRGMDSQENRDRAVGLLKRMASEK